MRRLLGALVAFAILGAVALPSLAQQPAPQVTPQAVPQITPPANPQITPPANPQITPPASPQITPPASPQATPEAIPQGIPQTVPQASLLSFTGQLLDVRNGYVFFTTGDAFKVAADMKIADYDTRSATTLTPSPKLFARATIDPKTHEVVELDLTKRRLPPDKSYAAAQAFVTVKSTPLPAPEIVGQRITGKEVPVAFNVIVPPNTPLDANVYITTDASGWDPQAIKLDRVDALHYRAVKRFASGTRFAFRVTRGNWTSVEIGQDGLALPPDDRHRIFFVREVDSQAVPVTVYAWSDQRPNQAAPQPGAIPTPFNPNPFPGGGIYPGSQATPPGGATPMPGRNPNLPPGH
jgi:hypothetical protein